MPYQYQDLLDAYEDTGPNRAFPMIKSYGLTQFVIELIADERYDMADTLTILNAIFKRLQEEGL